MGEGSVISHHSASCALGLVHGKMIISQGIAPPCVSAQA